MELKRGREQKMLNLTLRKKLMLGFGIINLLIILVGIYSLSQINLLGGLTAKMYNHPLTVTRASLQAEVNIIKMHRSMKDVALAKNTASMEAAIAKVAEYEAKVYEYYAVVEERILGQEGLDMIAETSQIFRDWKPVRDEVISLMIDDQRDEAAAITKGKGANHVKLLNQKMKELVDYAATKGAGFFEMARSSAHNAFVLTSTLLILSLITGVFIGFFLIRSIIHPVNTLRDIIEKIAANSDLTLAVDIKSNDEIGATAKAFNTMMHKIRSLMNRISASATQVATASEEMSAISEQSNQGILHQLSETEQVATAITEMAATVQEVARNAAGASGAASQADEQAAQGNHTVGQVINAIRDLADEVEKTSDVIHELNNESDNIGSVLDVIKSIAEQTNLLALNAAIEAARAGEQGRGFAVVADEVRTLASRTQESTTEIEAMIERLQSGAQNAAHAMDQGKEKTKNTVERAEEAGQALGEITKVVSTITDMNTQIASAAEEQSSVSEEINRNVVSIKDIASETSDGAKQTATASGELAKLAIDLQQIVSTFKV